MEGAKAMATISSVKFNVYRNAATKLTLHYCRKWKSPRKSVRKKRGTRKTRFSPGLRLELDCTQTNEIRTIRTSSQLLRTSVILQLHVDLKTEFLCEIFPPPLLWCWRRRRRRNSVRHFLGQIRFQTLHWDKRKPKKQILNLLRSILLNFCQKRSRRRKKLNQCRFRYLLAKTRLWNLPRKRSSILLWQDSWTMPTLLLWWMRRQQQ